jgi:shikimate kinase
MGAGKTTVGRLVADGCGAAFEDLDTAVEAAAGLTVAELFQREGEPAFRRLEAEGLPALLRPDTVVALGGGAPLQDALWKLVKAEAFSVFLDAPFPVLWARIAGGAGRPLAAGSDAAAMERLLAGRRPRYLEADRTVAGDRPAGEVAAEVGALWSG